MGLIKSAMESIAGTLADQDKTAINCPDMGNHILMVKRTNQNGIIRNKSRIIVNPGQLAVLVDNGRVIDATAEPGVYEFLTDAAPSFFAGNFGAVFKEMWTRFTFGAATYQDQAVYFMNVKEIIDNGFGTPAPVMYRDWEHSMLDARRPGQYVPMRVGIRCAGNYTFQIDRPDIFLQVIGGNTAIYEKDELCTQMRMEILASFSALLNSLCSEQNKINPLDLPSQSYNIKAMMDSQVFDQAIRNRGMRIVGFNIVSVTFDEESKRKIDEFELSGDSFAQQAKLTDAAILAADNAGGAGVGFMNLHMMNSAMGSMFPQTMPAPTMAQNAQQVHSQAPFAAAAAVQGAAAAQGVPCSKCGAAVSGKFCAECGTPAPVPAAAAAKFCSNCGAAINGKFCAECGTAQG